MSTEKDKDLRRVLNIFESIVVLEKTGWDLYNSYTVSSKYSAESKIRYMLREIDNEYIKTLPQDHKFRLKTEELKLMYMCLLKGVERHPFLFVSGELKR